MVRATRVAAACALAAGAVAAGENMRYTVRRVPAAPLAQADFRPAETGRLACVRPESSDHRPETVFRAVHDGEHLYVRFDVRDRYVRSVQTAYQAPVCTDSCVEAFVQPAGAAGYFNFEVNAGGALLLYYIEDPARTPEGFARFTRVAEEWGRRVEVWTSLPAVVEPERPGPLDWEARLKIPFALFERYAGPVGGAGTVWRANFYKCGDRTSHPHWLSWAPLDALNFHLPRCFGALALEAPAPEAATRAPQPR